VIFIVLVTLLAVEVVGAECGTGQLKSIQVTCGDCNGQLHNTYGCAGLTGKCDPIYKSIYCGMNGQLSCYYSEASTQFCGNSSTNGPTLIAGLYNLNVRPALLRVCNDNSALRVWLERTETHKRSAKVMARSTRKES